MGASRHRRGGLVEEGQGDGAQRRYGFRRAIARPVRRRQLRKMTEIRFYHLQRQRLEDALPALLEKGRERGYRIVVQAATPERVRALDALLWTYRPESFL